MSNTIPTNGSETLSASQQILVEQEKTIGAALKAMRKPGANEVDFERVGQMLQNLPAADALLVSSRVAEALERRAEKTGKEADYDLMLRATPYLPGQTPLARKALQEEARDDIRPSPALGLDARTVQQAISRLIDDRLPGSPAAAELKSHAAEALAERERLSGPILLTPEIRIQAGKPPVVHDLAQFEALVQKVSERRPGYEDRITEPQAAEVRQSLESRITGAPTLRDLQKLYSQEDVQRSVDAVARHPEQGALLNAAMEAAEARLLTRQRGLDIPDPPAKPATAPEASLDAADAPGIEITRRGDNGAPSFPLDAPDIARNYAIKVNGEEREYYQRDDGKLAIRANEQRIQGVLRDPRTIGAMLDIAASRGWNDVQIKGDRDIARDTWVEATARGMVAKGYQPTRADLHAAEQRRIERAQGIEMPSRQQAPAPPQRSDDVPARPIHKQPRPSRSKSPEGWTAQAGGFDNLSPKAQAAAERSYETWTKDNPELGRRHGLSDYVNYVQERQAEERARIDLPKVELPRRSMGL